MWMLSRSISTAADQLEGLRDAVSSFPRLRPSTTTTGAANKQAGATLEQDEPARWAVLETKLVGQEEGTELCKRALPSRAQPLTLAVGLRWQPPFKAFGRHAYGDTVDSGENNPMADKAIMNTALHNGLRDLERLVADFDD